MIQDKIMIEAAITGYVIGTVIGAVIFVAVLALLMTSKEQPDSDDRRHERP